MKSHKKPYKIFFSSGDSITNILEDMKSHEDATTSAAGLNSLGHIEYATAIPVSVTNMLSTSDKLDLTTLKRVATTSNVITASKRPRNIIFAGNTLPQGAIPIQISGLNTINGLNGLNAIPIR